MNLPEFIYTVLLRPKPLRKLANAVIRMCIPSRLKVGGAVVVLNRNDPVVSGALALRVYERPETKFFCAVCKPGMTILDIGANVGYYTALAIARLKENGRLIAPEPDPENFRYLEETVAANGFQHATCVQKAAGAEQGVRTLHTSSANRGDNRLYRNELADGSMEVEVCTIDALLREHGIHSVDLVKIDVQGYEGHVLRGMRETICRSANLVLLAEFWPFGLERAGTSPEALLLELEQAGLVLFQLTRRGTLKPLGSKTALIGGHQGRRYANLVAAREAMLPFLTS